VATLKAKVPPPVVALATALLMWLAAHLTPMLRFEIPARRMIAGVVFAIGLAIALSAVAWFRRARTTVNPLAPETVSSLVTSGIYRVTRNPMYLGLLFALLAWAVLLANPIALIFLPLFVLYMNRFQIGPEETALEARFGSEFLSYKAGVRRWL
jgi:protein-S-isoprenylcysteine O-methyltransferase Ste14